MLELLAEQREGSAYPAEAADGKALGAPSWLMLAHFSQFFAFFSHFWRILSHVGLFHRFFSDFY